MTIECDLCGSIFDPSIQSGACQCGAEYVFDEGFVLRASWVVQKIDRLQAIVDQLPKTADGVPVVPETDVFYPCPCMVGRPIHRSRIRSVWDTGWTDYSGRQPYFIRDGSIPYFSTEQLALEFRAKYYATLSREAAEAAKDLKARATADS